MFRLYTAIVPIFLAFSLMVGLLSLVGLASAETQDANTLYQTHVQTSLTHDYAIAIINPNATTALVVGTFYDMDGVIVVSIPTEVAPMSVTTIVASEHVPAGFTGSIVISSDQLLRAEGTHAGQGGSVILQAYEAGQSALSIPNVFKNGMFWSSVMVQNVSAIEADVIVGYAGLDCDQTVTLPAYGAFYTSTTADSCVPEGYEGRALIRADGARAGGSGGDFVASTLTYSRTTNDLMGGANGMTSPLAVTAGEFHAQPQPHQLSMLVLFVVVATGGLLITRRQTGTLDRHLQEK